VSIFTEIASARAESGNASAAKQALTATTRARESALCMREIYHRAKKSRLQIADRR
jgi:hypothetical protein